MSSLLTFKIRYLFLLTVILGTKHSGFAQFNEFLHFDGVDDEIFVGNFPIPRNSDFTIEFFFRPVSPPSITILDTLSSYMSDSNLLYLSIGGTNLSTGIGNFSMCSYWEDGSLKINSCYTQSYCPNLMQWTHIIVQYDLSNNTYWYHSGQSYNKITDHDNFIAGSTLHFGRHTNYGGPKLEFYIDEIRISDTMRYDLVTSPPLDQNTEFINDDHTVALWHLNSNLDDQSLNGYDFNSLGNPSFVNKSEFADSLYNIDLYSDFELCEGDSIILNRGNPSLNTTYVWENGSTDSIRIIKDTGTYILNTSGWCPFSDTIRIHSFDYQISLTDTMICKNDSVLIEVEQKDVNYLWSTEDTVNSIYVDSGIYWLKVYSKNCPTIDTLSDSINISSKSIDFTLRSDTILCSQDSLLLNANDLAPGNYYYTWSTGDTLESIYADEQNEIYNLLITDDFGCSWLDSVYIQWLRTPILQLPMDTTICQFESIWIEPKVTDQNNNYFPTSEYFILFSDYSEIVDSAENTYLFKPSSSLEIIAQAINKGCSSSLDNMNIHVVQVAETQVNASDSLLCLGDTALIYASGNDLYEWWINGVSIPSYNADSLIYIDKSAYIAVGGLSDKCKGIKDSIFIKIDSTVIQADFDVTPTFGFAEFRPIVVNNTIGAEFYSWDFGNGNQQNIDHSNEVLLKRLYYPVYNTEGTYSIKLVAERTSGCIDSVEKVIVVQGNRILQIPNAFSPNDDGLNDTWNIVTNDLSLRFSGTIYNRWGEKIHEFNQVEGPTLWDGTYRGDRVQIGVYPYLISIHHPSGLVSYHDGVIHLIE